MNNINGEIVNSFLMILTSSWQTHSAWIHLVLGDSLLAGSTRTFRGGACIR